MLVTIQLLVDPTGLLALVGWPGGSPQADLWWPIARYVVFVPVLLVAVWVAAARVGEHFWIMSFAGIWAVLLAQFATLVAMTWDVWLAAWGAGYVLAKALPTAVIIAVVTRFAGGRTAVFAPRQTAPDRLSPAAWPALLASACIAALPFGYWWAAPATGAMLPVPQPDRDLLLVVAGVALWLACVAAGLICAPLTWVFTARRRGARSGNTGRAIESPRRSPFAAITSALLACLLVATLITPTVQSMTPPSPATAPPDMLRVSDGRITDGVGNQILLRGVNVNQLVDFYAYDPEQPVTTPFTRGDVDAIAS